MSPSPIDQAATRRLPTIAVLPPPVMMVVPAGIHHRPVSRLIPGARWVDHINQVISAAHETEKLRANMHTGLRGYLVPSHTDFLDPYRHPLERAEPLPGPLGRLASGNPGQGRRPDGIRARYSQWPEVTRDPIAFKEWGGDFQGAVSAGRSIRGNV